MVLKLPEVANLGSYKALYSDDTEQDFFSNVVHLQVQALSECLSNCITGESNAIFIFPLFIGSSCRNTGEQGHLLALQMLSVLGI